MHSVRSRGSRVRRLVPAATVLAALFVAPVAADGRSDAGKISCDLSFELKGWSAFYKTAKGHGTIRCDDGQSVAVKLRVKGGGLTFGKSEITDGTGRFSAVRSIEDLLGSYASAEAHAGAVKSSTATALTKGEVSLALAGTGDGVDLGVSFGKFTIKRR